MNRILLRTVAGVLAAFPLLMVGAQEEEEVNADLNNSGGFAVSTSGELQSLAVAGTQKKSFGKDHAYFAVSGTITFNPSMTTTKGVTLGGNVGLSADASMGQQCQSGISEAYLSAAGNFGEFQFGNQSSAADEMSIDGTTVLGGQEGAAGSIANVFNVSGGSLLQTGITADDGIATKIIYMSPILKGAQLGVSYTPNSQSVGMLQNVTNINYQYHMAPYVTQGNLQNETDDSGFKTPNANEKHSRSNPSSLPAKDDDLSAGAFYLNGVTAALAYNYGSDEAFNLALAGCGWYGQGKPQAPGDGRVVEDLIAFQVGGTIGYKIFKLAIGYADNLKSLMTKVYKASEGIQKGADMGKVYTAGLALEYKSWKASAGYYHSVKKYAEKGDQTTGQVITGTVDYKILDGVVAYGEFDHVRTKGRSTKEKRSWVNSTTPFEDNQGNFFWLGTKINF
ncbi:MAG: porin [Holosporales bacterium]|jgi:hypothetical protein|nr:porin [Holosporales bacterium]